MSAGRLKATFSRIRESIEITLDHKHINIFKEHEEKATRKKVDHLTFRQRFGPSFNRQQVTRVQPWRSYYAQQQAFEPLLLIEVRSEILDVSLSRFEVFKVQR
ncbi:hypothetical protein I308_104917 [Cryptococcus tetragattii IND107]|uniref:Uncharacterized protein n=1 Tax=Cryptococcus tetragattii IND107 TaxID=1296105 RepID=A0ABR3BPT4_9TREE